MPKVGTGIRPLCNHCHLRSQRRGSRGLCTKCYLNVSVRKQHTPHHFTANGKNECDVTMEELEQMITEQLPTMPGGKPEGWKAAQERLRWHLPVFKRDRRRNGVKTRSE